MFLPVAWTERRRSGVPDLGADFPPAPLPPHTHSPREPGAGPAPSSGGGGALAARSARAGRSPRPAPPRVAAAPLSRAPLALTWDLYVRVLRPF